MGGQNKYVYRFYSDLDTSAWFGSCNANKTDVQKEADTETKAQGLIHSAKLCSYSPGMGRQP